MNFSPPLPAAEALEPHPQLEGYYQGSKGAFIRRIFDQGARDYDRIERMMALGSGSWYRRKALLRAGLAGGQRALDVAIGTGLVAREAIGIVGETGRVVGVDPSAGMLGQARKALAISAVMGVAEQLPVTEGAFDFVSMGYALRHVSDLRAAFGEFHRVLRPGGTVCILELTRPAGRVRTALLRAYMRGVIPLLGRLVTRNAPSQLLWQYYWDTIESCIAPEQVMGALEGAGFVDVKRHTELGIFSEYTGRKGELAISRAGRI
jgi:demethylmenaquinone methyltransferase/2-methoxy-6-polyprenyl-1,4-benzoquinol methylase